MTETPKWCCRMQPEVFTDTRVGSAIEKRVVTCAGCGKFSEGDTTPAAVWEWNHGEREKNPIDYEFVNSLKSAVRP